jgi:acyl-CoA dehydrogenase
VRRDVFTADHEAFREVVRDFLAKEVVPHFPEWEKAGHLPRQAAPARS